MVTLRWRAPEMALSFDVIRGDGSDLNLNSSAGKVVLVTNFNGSAFMDDNTATRAYDPAKYNNGDLSRTVFSRIMRPAGNLRAFHNAMLECIEAEAGGVANPCAAVKLSKLPPEGRGQ